MKESQSFAPEVPAANSEDPYLVVRESYLVRTSPQHQHQHPNLSFAPEVCCSDEEFEGEDFPGALLSLNPSLLKSAVPTKPCRNSDLEILLGFSSSQSFAPEVCGGQ